ncbi:MAG: sodium/solute symporter [Phycisphaerae bacterium]|nr:sodium/solute symporter [Phycisphaerae bacterium]
MVSAPVSGLASSLLSVLTGESAGGSVCRAWLGASGSRRVRVAFLVLLFAAPVMAQSAPAAASDSSPAATAQASPSAPLAAGEGGGLAHRRLVLLDWLVIGAYGVGMLAIGWLASRKTKTSEDYLLGGRKLNASAVGLSLFATLISTISYLAVPGEIIKHGPVFLAYIAAIPIIYVVTGYLLIPYIMRLPVTSAYEILESTLGIEVRLLGSIIFLFTRLVWMGLILFASTRAMVAMLGLAPETAFYLGVGMSLVTVVYTSTGGLRASVVAGAVQTLVLLGGAVVSVFYVTYEMGGVRPWWPAEWASNWDVQPFFSFDPHVRATVLGMVITTVVWWVCTAGSDQMAIQRYLSTRDARSARHAFLVNNCADVLTTLALAFLGFALLAFFRSHAASLPAEYNLVTNADYLFPYFIVNVLPAGLGGLVIAGLLAAAMSSLSAGFNSCCSVVTVDLVDRFREQKSAAERHLRMMRYISVVVGLITVGLSLLMGHVSGNLVEMANKTTNLFVAPLFCLFFMAMFVPFATAFGTFSGAVYGLAAGVLVGYWDQLTGEAALSWTWITPASLMASIVVGCVFSLLPTRGRSWPILTGWALLAAAPLVLCSVAVVRW